MTGISSDTIIPDTAKIDTSVTIGPRVVLAGDGIELHADVRLDAACVIGEGVTVGQGAWVRAGAVVLRSVPPNSIVEGNPAQVVGYRGTTGTDRLPDTRHIDISVHDHLTRPTRVSASHGPSPETPF